MKVEDILTMPELSPIAKMAMKRIRPIVKKMIAIYSVPLGPCHYLLQEFLNVEDKNIQKRNEEQFNNSIYYFNSNKQIEKELAKLTWDDNVV